MKPKQGMVGEGKSNRSVIVCTLFRLMSNQAEYREEIGGNEIQCALIIDDETFTPLYLSIRLIQFCLHKQLAL